MFTNFSQTDYLMSAQVTHRATWGRFVNWRGGAGDNMEANLVQEICNKVSKNVAQGMGPNKTKAAIERASKAGAGIQEVICNYDGASGVKPRSGAHTKMSAKADELEIIEALKKSKPFCIVPGRKHDSFPNIEISPLEQLDRDDLYLWLDKHKRQISLIPSVKYILILAFLYNECFTIVIPEHCPGRYSG